MLALGGVAVICPECSNQWTLSIAVAISWFCPRCGGARTGGTFQHFCACGHRYNQHETHQKVKPSRNAFGIHNIGRLARILGSDPKAAPKLGRCSACNCDRYQLDPPPLTPNEFLNEIQNAAQRGAGGRDIAVSAVGDGALEFRSARSSVRLRVQPGGTIRIGRSRVLKMASDGVGATVIAIREALRLHRSM